MSDTAEEQKFEALEESIRALLEQRLGQGALEIPDVIYITIKLGKAKTVDELRIAAQEIAEKYPLIKDIFLNEAQHERESMHDVVKNFVGQFVLQDAVKAARLSEMALRKDVTLDQLFTFCPEFKTYYEQNKA